MPIHEQNGGEQWGHHGKVYYGPHAKEKAAKQAAAAHANGYKGDEVRDDKSLEKGASEEAISKHIGELINEGYPRDQAVAIAYREAGKSRSDADADTYCSGVLFMDGNHVLLLHRSDRDEWEGAGGHIEKGETAKDAALRETEEELAIPSSAYKLMDGSHETSGDGVEYTTFFAKAPKEFNPELNHEHDEGRWFPVNELPDSVHPGVKLALDGHLSRKDSMNELTIAKKIRDGELESPQQYENIWLFAVRVTGTGTAYRPAHEEIAYRPPENFLTDEFVERCNGLPLIFEHPDESILDTDEFRQRSIGTVILPYIEGDEVWGIARVYDDDGAQLMRTSHTSTSPAVVFRDAGSTESVDIDGQTVLIEGKPSYLDHLAICEAGVWDKGGEPSGVKNGGNPMAEKEEMPAWADALVKRMDAMEAKHEERKDSKESENKQAEELEELAKEEREEGDKEAKADSEEEKEEEKADESHEEEAEKEPRDKEGEFADSEEKEEEKEERSDMDGEEKGTPVKADSIDAAVRKEVSRRLKPVSIDDRNELARAQARADGVAQLFGSEASQPLHGETPLEYRIRLASKFQKHSPKVASVKLDSLGSDAFAIIEDQIYADAVQAARSPSNMRPLELIPVVRRDSSGREITRYEGDPMAWMQYFTQQGGTARIVRSHNQGVK